jgi:hypothetical protein
VVQGYYYYTPAPPFRWQNIMIFPDFFPPREMAAFAYLIRVTAERLCQISRIF